MSQFAKTGILFPETPVSALTWYWLLGPLYASLNLLTVSLTPASTSAFSAYVSMCFGSGVALWLYLRLGLSKRKQVQLKNWHKAMITMWLNGTVLMILVALPLPVWLSWLSTEPARASQLLNSVAIPLVLGFLFVSGFSVLVYALLYRVIMRIITAYHTTS